MDLSAIKPDLLNRLFSAIQIESAVKATAFLSPSLTVKMTKRTYKKRDRSKPRLQEFNLTIGAPNFEERQFIKLCRKAKERFPVKNIIMKFPKVKK